MGLLDTIGIIKMSREEQAKERAEEILLKEVSRRTLRVFNTGEGRKVLTEILFSLGFGRRLASAEDTARYNEAVNVLEKLGFRFYEDGERLVEEMLKIAASRHKDNGTEEKV